MEADPISARFYAAIGRMSLLATRLDCVAIVAAGNITGDGDHSRLIRRCTDAAAVDGTLAEALAEARQGGWFPDHVLDQYDRWALAVRKARQTYERITYDPAVLLEDRRDRPDAYIRLDDVVELPIWVTLTELDALAGRVDELARAGYDEFVPFPNRKRVLVIPAPRTAEPAVGAAVIDLRETAPGGRRNWPSWRGHGR